MNKVLIINASVRNEKSHSRKLTQLFEDNWIKKNPNDIFTYREVGLEEIPPINDKWIASAFIIPSERTNENQSSVKFSDELVKEFKEHNIYVLGTPMYNWSIPSGLKSYIDHLMRINETWKFRSGEPDGDYVGLLENKKMFILSSRGDTGYGKSEKNEHMNFQTTYLKFVFGIMGINDISIVSLDNEEFGGKIFESSKKKIYQRIEQF
ncbi:NAD(P)H-dependent oxidoreductase [Tamlana sp. 2_MG-2023]|uniref:FMN-dependent NADH-azoreductase n=1 Tax=unclassified Tamlana TaxID=2614803 RepID=UPI0026E2B769|nr:MULTISPECIES: NAD(P)H-dependent oxidoreductase [unclassified Tamlana]MDO6761670.1 NAD(P)H-dependent oxidoreductase [Tamlana sp. 2_MG-2023]MDO6792224.1 NAD(P)H-dependent oxidoreductase [Tamlana sp. 1_MG-2023]